MKKKSKLVEQQSSQGEIILFQTQGGDSRIEVKLVNETVWLSLNQMAELFQRDKSSISKHIKNIFEEGELEENQTVAKFATVQTEGKKSITRQIEYYNLNVIISVGYRVKSHRGTQFRIWATQQLKEYLVKGFIMDDERLKNRDNGKYFDELLVRVRDIRSSEKVFWRKILDIYSTSIDYDPKVESSIQFFKVIQNKMHWAAHGQTAAEVISARVSAEKHNLGLTSWSGEQIKKTDVIVAKNYLKVEEIKALNLIVSLYFDFAELQALDRKPMYMKDWILKLDDFLKLSSRNILNHSGKITHEAAAKKAHEEYQKYSKILANKTTPVEIHFEETIKRLTKIQKSNKKN